MLLAGLALACAPGGSSPVTEDSPPRQLASLQGAVSRLEVSFTPRAAERLERERAARTTAAVRQSARDWLESRGRLAPDGGFHVQVDLDSLQLRGPLATWFLAAVVAPDHLAGRVVVRRSSGTVAVFRVRVESALSGYAWRDAEARLDRLARRLGQRLAARLGGGL